jgi:hypothetical protein
MKATFARSKPARVFLTVLILAVLSQSAAHATPRALAAPAAPAAPGSPNSSGPFACTINLIWVTSSTAQVECTTPLPGTLVYYFAPPADAASSLSTNRMLVLINTAYSLGKPLNIYYTADSASNPPGCLAGTCRRLDGVSIQP